VPRNRAEVEAYFESWRPQLVATEHAQQMMDHLLNGVNAVVPRKGVAGVIRPVANLAQRKAVIATMPKHMRVLAGVRQGPVTDATVTIASRLAFRGLASSVASQRWILSVLAPKTLPVVEPRWRGIEPIQDKVWTPAEAREHFGFVRPSEAHMDMRERQYQRVFGEGLAPSEDGILESQALLGRIARD
jgi:hypothetical protein